MRAKRNITPPKEIELCYNPPMPKAAAKAPWEVAIERLAKMIAKDKAEAKAEAAKAKAEADKRAKEAKAEADKRAKEAAAAADKRAAESKEEMAELRRIMGIQPTEEGEMLEYDVAAAIVRDMALGGVKFDEVITNAFVHGKHGEGEFDWIGINGKITMVGETRRTLNRGDVRRFFADRMELFRRAFPHYAKGRKVQGAMIYQKAKAGAIEEALKLKMKVFRAEDDKTLRPVRTIADIPKRTRTKTHKRT